ncbi:MAG: PadR family transcriptional regulator [Chloroflexi bacterium]|nr:PadR family transcriptional regulator [Chloroflexota bacterium]
MSLKHTLLGFLNYGPMTGYELKKAFDVSVAHFWNAELSQIYPTLKQMEGEGLVEMRVDVQQDRPNRKVYSISEAGHQELLEWLGKPAEPDQIREPILIKVFFGASLRKEELIGVLRQRIEELHGYSQYLEQCRTLSQMFAKAIGHETDGLFWSLTPLLGQKQCQAEIEWAEDAIRTIEELDESAFSEECRHGDVELRRAMEMFAKAAIGHSASEHGAGGDDEGD